MLGQEGLRRDDSGDFAKDATPKQLGLGCQAAALIVVQTESFASQLLPEHSVLFAEVIDGVTLLLAQPAGDGNQQQSKRIEGPAHWHRIAAKTAVTGAANCSASSRSSSWTLPDLGIWPPSQDSNLQPFGW
ncbi:MAG: hypothetical protein OEV08_13490, partial [Nitrospira sp.]|nr:hypothetical protein [Nitrospira sp.]